MSEKNYLDPEQNPFIKLDPVSEADKLPGSDGLPYRCPLGILEAGEDRAAFALEAERKMGKILKTTKRTKGRT